MRQKFHFNWIALLGSLSDSYRKLTPLLQREYLGKELTLPMNKEVNKVKTHVKLYFCTQMLLLTYGVWHGCTARTHLYLHDSEELGPS